MNTKIITLTGASGAGKSSIVKKLIELKPEIELVISLTSRSPRSTDLDGEYVCDVSREDFLLHRAFQHVFLWITEAHGNAYGTLRMSVDWALTKNAVSVMILVPDVVRILRDYCGSNTLSFYILSPDERELRKRLLLREENELEIEKRIADCKQWDERARQSEIPYIFVTNKITENPQMGIEKAAREILGYLES